MSQYEYDFQDYNKLLNYCAEIVKANIDRFKDASLSEIKASIETELETYKEVEK
jgi:hypothetical protein